MRILSLIREPQWLAKMDVVFCSFPKTGNTWLRFLIGRYVQSLLGMQTMPLFDGSEKDNGAFRDYAGPYLTFTHAPLEWSKQLPGDLTVDNVVRPFRRKRVVLLVRHPLDTMVSWYMQNSRKTTIFEGELEAFMDDTTLGLEKYFAFYGVWYKNRHRVREFMIHRYEDARRDPERHLERVLSFCGLGIDHEQLNEAVKFSRFDNMQEMEKRGDDVRYPSSGLRVFGESDAGDPESWRVRKGIVGGYREYLSERQIHRYEQLMHERMPKAFGYEETWECMR